MSKVTFIALTEATKEEHELIAEDVRKDQAELPLHLLEALRRLADYQRSLQVTRLEHSLQSATRAHRDNRDEEYVVAALLHDIGDTLAPYSHGPMVGAVLKPFMSPRMCWIVEKHPLFQTYYYAHLLGGDRYARDKYKDHPFYQDCVDFCELYDQNCFDPNFESLPVEFFAPMVHRIFEREPQFSASDS